MEKSKTKECTYTTRDLTMAAFIWSQKGAVLHNVGVTSEGGFSLHFHFKLPMDDRDLAKLVMEYANNQALVEPQIFVQKQNNVRDVLHTYKKKDRKHD